MPTPNPAEEDKQNIRFIWNEIQTTHYGHRFEFYLATEGIMLNNNIYRVRVLISRCSTCNKPISYSLITENLNKVLKDSGLLIDIVNR